MKKLSIISNQIKNNTYSYTGKGSFEAIVNKNKELVLGWLEELIPLQNQIELLLELEGIEFQKRNYTRILTKVFPEEYREFVSLNILVRDANILAQYYNEEYNITILYDNLIKDKYLKYPGKYEKYVEFLIFQKFVMMYRDELISSLNNDHQSLISNNKEQREEDRRRELEKEIIEDSIINETIEETSAEEVKEVELEKEIKLAKESEDNNTNWTNLLLGKLK
ncbi:MAG: hypothetical protein ACI81I_000482 [Arcobacteraceae bacterium]|jgi:hypothetical protein